MISGEDLKAALEDLSSALDALDAGDGFACRLAIEAVVARLNPPAPRLNWLRDLGSVIHPEDHP